MPSLPVLYSFRRCPYAMRARMAIAISEVVIEAREILLREKPPEMLAASPKGTVPVVVLPDGRVLEESLDIMHWALAQNDPENWLNSVHLPLIESNDGPFKYALDRYKYPHRYDLPNGLAHRDAGLAHLQILDQKLTASPFLGGERRGFVDMALFPFIRQFANTDREWFDALHLNALKRWLERMISSDLFDTIMRKNPVWNNSADAI